MSNSLAGSPSRYWGRRLDNAPTDFIFGYGTLVNAHLRDQTSLAPIAGLPARISAEFGYLRAWVFRSATGFTALGLRRPRQGEAAMTVNGVIYPVRADDLAAFDLREAGYRRIPAPAEYIEAVSWQSLPNTGTIWIYVPVSEECTDSPGSLCADCDFPILQSYIDAIVEGALDYGSDYAREMIETTADWSRFWLNDRAMARRPWVFDRHFAETDALLAVTEPAAAHFADRLFPGPFSARWLFHQRRTRLVRTVSVSQRAARRQALPSPAAPLGDGPESAPLV